MSVLRRASNSPLNGRVAGQETEYVVSFVPVRKVPPDYLLLGVVEDTILRQGKCCESANGGYFLENGGAVSLESRLERRDNPVLELATPECSDPWELLLYLRSHELLLERTAAQAEQILRRHGYPGRILFVKSNQDWRGASLGSHENYWIRWRESLPIALTGSLLLFVTASLISCFSTLCAFSTVLFFRFGSFFKRKLRRKKAMKRSFWETQLREGKPHLFRRFPLARIPDLAPLLQRLRQYVLRSFISVVEPILAPFMMPRLSRELLPFLVTRQIFSGAGALRYGSGKTSLHLSMRAGVLKRVTGVSFGQRGRAVFDLKPFLRDPLSLLRRQKRLCVAAGDSLMSESAVFLTAGTTSLVLSMIEGGERFSALAPASPLRAWNAISEGGPRARVLLADRRRRSALEIQREFLDRAKRFFASSPAGSLPDQVITLWDGVLESLAERPAALWGQVDWVTKKQLLDPLVFAEGNWKEFARWGRFFEELKKRLPRTRPLSDLCFHEALGYFTRAERNLYPVVCAATAEEFERFLNLFLACAKLTFGYHELSRIGGYYQKLRRAGQVPSLIDDEDALKAHTKAPVRTRANIRARAIALTEAPGDLEASWEKLHSPVSNVSVKILDPSLHFCPGSE